MNTDGMKRSLMSSCRSERYRDLCAVSFQDLVDLRLAITPGISNCLHARDTKDVERSHHPTQRVRNKNKKVWRSQRTVINTARSITYRAAPSVARVDVGLPLEQDADDVLVPLARGDVQRGAAVEVDAVDVDAAAQQALDAGRVAVAREEEQLHGGVQVVRHGQLRLRRPHGALAPPAPAVRVHRRLPPEQEPARRAPRPRRLHRRLPPELGGVLHGAPGHLPVQRDLRARRRHIGVRPVQFGGAHFTGPRAAISCGVRDQGIREQTGPRRWDRGPRGTRECAGEPRRDEFRGRLCAAW
jgi:hypothetical protein